MKTSRFAVGLLFTLYALFAACLSAACLLPWTLNRSVIFLTDAFQAVPGYYGFLLAFLLVAAALGLWILGEMIGMLRTVPKSPFCARNVRALRRVGWAGLALAALFLGKCVWFFTILTCVCGVVLLICALCAFTLCDLFRQALAYKRENDLTI